MRLRILTVSPLPDLKVWFSAHSLGPSATVADLKIDICARVQSLKDAQIHGCDIVLVLDEFDLLNEDSIDVLRDGDLICMRFLPGKSSTKRKTLHDESPSPKRAKGSPPKQSLPISINKQSQQKHEQELSSESSSGSESSSSDSESSVSTSDSDLASRNAVGKAITATLVPPGQGKHTTHSRNIRRRLKKQYERNGGRSHSTAPPVGSSVANIQPLGLKRANQDMSLSADGDTLMSSNLGTTVMMSSLRNKNKKKGFKNAMVKPLPKKIIFSSAEDNHEPASSTAFSSATTITTPTAQADTNFSLPQLITPSERQDLPPNIFVTVVDVEEGLSSKKSKQRCETYTANEDDGDMCWLDHGGEKDVAVNDTAVKELDFESAERQWETFLVITELHQLKPDVVVGWKDLAINPSTFTPEILLKLAVVSSCHDEEVLVRLLHRPGATQISFGGTLEQEGEVDEESYEWPFVLTAKWRIVTLGV